MQINHKSCEMLAEEVILYVQKTYPGRSVEVHVHEDNENGAILFSE